MTVWKKSLLMPGIGIKNIVETIEKYGGSYVIQNKNQEFYFSIMIPMKKVKIEETTV